jgi:hypothetical protein
MYRPCSTYPPFADIGRIQYLPFLCLSFSIKTTLKERLKLLILRLEFTFDFLINLAVCLEILLLRTEHKYSTFCSHMKEMIQFARVFLVYLDV